VVFAFLGGLLPLLAKEDGIAFAVMFWFLAAAFDGKDLLRLMLMAGVTMALCMRYWALGDNFYGTGQAPLADAFWLERVDEGLGITLVALRGLVEPTHTPLALAPGDHELYQGKTAWLVIVATTIQYLLYAWREWTPSEPARSSLKRATSWGALAGFLTAWSPWFQVLPGPELFGWRAVYLPLLFVCPLVWGLTPARPCGPYWNRFKATLGALFFVFCAWGVFHVKPAFASAVEHWRYRTHLEGHRAMVWNGYGQELLALDEYDDAAIAFKRTLLIDGQHAAAWVGLANCSPFLTDELRAELERDLRGQLANRNTGGDPVDLEQEPVKLTEENALRQALLSQPEHTSAWARKGRLERDQGEYEQALKSYELALRFDQDRMILWADYSTVLFALGRYEEAHTALLRAFKLDPQHPWLTTLAQRQRMTLPESAPR